MKSNSALMRNLRMAIALSSCSAALQAADLDSVRNFHIAPQRLETALIEFSKQADLQVIGSTETLGDTASIGVSGELSSREALSLLLKNTHIAFNSVGSHSVQIVPVRARPTAQETSAYHPVHFAQATSAPETPALQTPGNSASAREETGDDQAVEQVVVTGSRLSQSETQGPQEVTVYRREAIVQSGQQTLLDFLNTLPAVSTPVTEAGYDTVSGAGAVRLRGLPIGSTLVLLDGRNVEGAASGQSHGNPFDLNSIPNAAVERIEVVPEAASAVYGSDAIGGVVNIILRKNFEGIEFAASTGRPTDGTYSDTTASFVVGKTFSRASFSLIASEQVRGSLRTDDRELTSDQDYRRYGGADERSSNCAPGNVSTLDGANLPGLTSPFAAIPESSSGILTTADFLATSGTSRTCSYGAYGVSLIPATRRASALGHGSYQITDNIQAFVEGIYSELGQNSYSSPRSVYGQIVPADNPFNPFGVPVSVTYRFASEGNYGGGIGNIYFSRVLGGLKGTLGSRWDWELAAWQSKDHANLRETNTINNSALAAALANTDPAQTLNLFATGSPGSAAVLAPIVYDAPSLSSSRLQTVNGFVRGELFNLPAGPLRVVLGGEYNRMRQFLFVPGEGQVVPDDFARQSRSAFAELHIPLVAGAPRLGDRLAVSFAGRYDNYSDFGHRFTPQGGIEFRPTETLLLRASYSKAFKAPDLRSVYSSSISYSGIDLPPDPLRGGAVYAADFHLGGNRDLDPQTGKSRSFGLVWSSRAIAGLDVRVTNFKVTQDDRVTQPSVYDMLANPDAFPGRIVRAAPTAEDLANGFAGQILSVDLSYTNYGSLDVEGFDYDVEYRIDSRVGTFTPKLSVTQIYKYDASVSPSTPVEDRLDKASADAFATRWRGTAALNYARGSFSAWVDGRYMSQYIDYDRARTLGSDWFFDASAQLDLGKSAFNNRGFFRGAYASVAVVNLFDKQPDFTDYYGTGYDPRMSDIRGRFATLTLGLRW